VTTTDGHTPATVFIVDDDEDFRKTLGWLLEQAGHRVEGFASAHAFLDAYDPARPGCLLLDVRLRGMTGLQLLERLGGTAAPLPVIMMTGYGDFSTAVRALKGGAADILQKPMDDHDLLERIADALAADERTRASRVERTLVTAHLRQLTSRERAVLELIVMGKSSKEIATELGVSPRTVESHRANVLAKMEAASTAHLVRMVMLTRPAR